MKASISRQHLRGVVFLFSYFGVREPIPPAARGEPVVDFDQALDQAAALLGEAGADADQQEEEGGDEDGGHGTLLAGSEAGKVGRHVAGVVDVSSCCLVAQVGEKVASAPTHAGAT